MCESARFNLTYINAVAGKTPKRSKKEGMSWKVEVAMRKSEKEGRGRSGKKEIRSLYNSEPSVGSD